MIAIKFLKHNLWFTVFNESNKIKKHAFQNFAI